jgi:hypothetical protein
MKSTSWAAIVAFALISLTACGGGAQPSTLAETSSRVSPKASVASSVAATTPGATPAQSPSAAPTAGPAVPEALQFRWIGPLRDVPQITPKTNFAGLEMAAHTTWFYPYTQGDGPDLRSTTSSPSANELAFVTVADGAGCHSNDEGTYTYSLDATQTQLTLTPTSDQCEARSAAFAGDWTRSACPDPRGWCLGDLAAGDYQSAVFTPFIPAESWSYDFGEISYTVPSDWANPEDTPGGYRLEQQGAPEFTATYVFADVLAHSQAADCPEEPDTTVGTSAADLTDWLTNLPSVTTTTPAPVTIGGLSGSTLDVSLAPDWTRACPFSEGQPTAPLFSIADPQNDFDWGVGGDGHMRLFLLELPTDRTLLIDIESTDKETWDALLPEAMPVVESFAFRTP